MPNSPDGDQKKSGLLGQILAGVAIALIAGGTSPWWYSALFSKPTPSIQVSRDFMIGRWQFSDTNGDQMLNFFANGTLELTDAHSTGGMSGTWDFEKLSDRTFIMRVAIKDSNEAPRLMKFEVFDQNHVQSIDDQKRKYLFERLH